MDNIGHGHHSALEFMPGEGPIPLRAMEPTESISMVLPKF